jgi:chromosome segregation ATPase
MALLGNKKNKIPVSKKDLNQAIVKKNDSLKKSNSVLNDRIKELDKTKSLYKDEIKSLKPEIQKLNVDLSKAKDKLSSIDEDISARKDSLSKLSIKSSEAKSMANMHLELVDKSKEELKEIQDKQSLYLKDLSKSNELASNIKSQVSEIEILNKEISRLEKDKAKYDSLKEDYSSLMEDHLSIRTHIEKRKKEFLATIEDIEKKTSNAKRESIVSSKKMQDELAGKNLQLDELDVMISKAKTKKDNELKKIDKAKESLKSEKAKIEKIKESFEAWKVSALDEMARMKLRGRMENIDKAGLKDVLS